MRRVLSDSSDYSAGAHTSGGNAASLTRRKVGGGEGGACDAAAAAAADDIPHFCSALLHWEGGGHTAVALQRLKWGGGRVQIISNLIDEMLMEH